MFNKLKKHCWDKELLEVLAPNGKYSYRDVPHEPRVKKTLIASQNKEQKSKVVANDVKREVKDE